MKLPKFVTFWRPWFRRSLPPTPVMLRVVDSNGPVERVTLDITWHPSGRKRRTERPTAMGLCIIPWMGDQQSLEIAISAHNRTDRIVVDRTRAESDRVQEVRIS